jgi:hypothetical protein
VGVNQNATRMPRDWRFLHSAGHGIKAAVKENTDRKHAHSNADAGYCTPKLQLTNL